MAVGSKLNVGGAGPDLVAADITAHANWGTDPVITVADGSNDAAGVITVVAKATTGAGPTLVVPFSKQKDDVPAVVVTRGDAIANAAGEVHASADVDEITISFDGTPTADQTYVFNYIVAELV
jgi:hypothetical protein